MSYLRDVTQTSWRRLYALGPWEIYLVEMPNRYGWAEVTVRLLDARAGKRSWWFTWNVSEARVARTPDSERLALEHPVFMRDLQLKLRNWRPQP
jgi:hypothetical protein